MCDLNLLCASLFVLAALASGVLSSASGPAQIALLQFQLLAPAR
jgi:hypothetical protein